MKNLLEKLKAEPVMAAAVVLAVFLAALITANVISMEDVNRFVALVVVLVPIVLGLLTRQFTAPATGDAGAVRENAVVARTLGRVASGEITAETMGAPLGGDAMSHTSVDGVRQTWQQLVDLGRERYSNANRWAVLVSDLDRCEHGRHEGDACSSCGGPSVGNPLLPTGTLLGHTLSAEPITVPERARRHAIDAWTAKAAS